MIRHLRFMVPLLLAATACVRTSDVAPPSPAPVATAQAPAPSASAPSATAGSQADLAVPVEYFKLPNGLKVVLSPDRTSPVASVGVYYHIGFRIEPRDRTGFAHLFEHLMFQGSRNLGKMEFIRLIQSNGGVLNGSTRFDFTNYFQIVPAHTVETVLWAEADRMRGLAITQENLTNQQGVVKNEVRVNVINQPYGGFPWIDLPMAANQNWYNAHNFYGDLEDLDAATLEDAASFFKTYYAPNNAVVVVVGDIDVAQTRQWVEKHFGDIPAVTQPAMPDLTEPPQTAEKRVSKSYPKAPRPGLALGWHAPDRESQDYYTLGLIDQILAQGKDSRLYRRLVNEKGYTGDVDGSLNFLGNMFNIEGPTLYAVSLFHDKTTSADTIIGVIDEEIARLQNTPVDQATLDLARTKLRSSFYDMLEGFFGFGRADLLASFALFFDDPARINTLMKRFDSITPEMIQQTAREYLKPSNRTIVLAEAGGAS